MSLNLFVRLHANLHAHEPHQHQRGDMSQKHIEEDMRDFGSVSHVCGPNYDTIEELKTSKYF